MMPNKSIYRDADAAEINLYELNFARFFSIQTSENGWRRVVCELVRRAAKGTKELRLEDGTELPGEKTFPDYVVDLMELPGGFAGCKAPCLSCCRAGTADGTSLPSY